MRTASSSWVYWVFAACGTWLIALGVYFALFRPALLPEDIRYLRISAEVLASLKALPHWLQNVFVVLGGFMIATGTLTIAVAHTAPTSRASLVSLAIAGISGVGVMCVVNFVIDSDYKWLLSLPAVGWLMASIVQFTQVRKLDTGRQS